MSKQLVLLSYEIDVPALPRRNDEDISAYLVRRLKQISALGVPINVKMATEMQIEEFLATEDRKRTH